MTPLEAAVLLKWQLERHGATFRINEFGDLRACLDGVPHDAFRVSRAAIVAMVFDLADEIKQLIARDRTEH